jgi:hypothetical protein
MPKEIAMAPGVSKRLIVVFASAIVGWVLIKAGSEAAEGFQRLSGAQIRARFAGMQLTDEVHWGEVYAPNGTLTSESMGRKRVGTWRVQNNQLCTDLGKDGGNNCYEVWMSGKKIELRLPEAIDAALEGVLEKPANRR